MALFDLSKKTEQDRFKYAILKAVESGATVDLTRKQNGTLSQNNYFHLLCAYFGLCYGEKTEYIKTEIVKKRVCKDIFLTEYINRKTGEIREDLKSWRDINKEERCLVISQFLNWSAKEAKIRLPEPNDLQYIKEIQIELDRNKEYL